MKLSKYFKRKEFLCNGNKKGICKCGFDVVDVELLQVLEDVREHFKKPVKIYSACRCNKYNKYVGGAKRSQHKLGKAADIHIDKVHPKWIAEYLKHKYPTKYGIGLYQNFVHVDVRKNKARWNG